MQPQILAFHLPQYHTFKENDEWWGKGFTEWVNVKKAKPLYNGHNQPRVPLNRDYYNLMEYETRKWQADLAKKYGIYGFCYYHYWFNGRMLMEKPCEALLEEKDIDFPFCFCWANEPWTRAWDGKSKEVIMPQEYGDKKEWKAHIDYLLKFFKDQRYIKVDGAPMFVLYRTNNIDRCDDMVEFWDKECKKNGFTGIHIVEERNNFQNEPCCQNSQAYLDFEPMHVWKWEKHGLAKVKDVIDNHLVKDITKRSYYRFSYDDYWKKILNAKETVSDKSHYLGAFVDWDNTSRRAKNGLVCIGVTPEKFSSYLEKLLNIAEKKNSSFIFLNAWNEWAEGTYLEPDEKNFYGFLEAVKKAVGTGDERDGR